MFCSTGFPEMIFRRIFKLDQLTGH